MQNYIVIPEEYSIYSDKNDIALKCFSNKEEAEKYKIYIEMKYRIDVEIILESINECFEYPEDYEQIKREFESEYGANTNNKKLKNTNDGDIDKLKELQSDLEKANNGDSDAMIKVGYYYCNIYPIENEKAIKYFKMAEEKGHKESYVCLANCYEYDGDLEKAEFYFNLSVEKYGKSGRIV